LRTKLWEFVSADRGNAIDSSFSAYEITAALSESLGRAEGEMEAPFSIGAWVSLAISTS
jgi:hypothetical protein